MTTQDKIAQKISELYPDAIVKKINQDNFLDIHLPKVHPKKGTHLFFKTVSGGIKIGFFCRDVGFIEAVLSNNKELDKYSSGIRLNGDPIFHHAEEALDGANHFISKLLNTEKPDSVMKSEPVVELEMDEDGGKGGPFLRFRNITNEDGTLDEEAMREARKYLLGRWTCPTSKYNNMLNVLQSRIPEWIVLLNDESRFPLYTEEQMEFIKNIIITDTVIPVITDWSPADLRMMMADVWWIIPFAVIAENFSSWVAINKNGFYAAHPTDDDCQMIVSWDNVEDIDTDYLEESLIRLTIYLEGERFLTLDEFINPGRGSYLETLEYIYVNRKDTIEASKGGNIWIEGFGGEGFVSFKEAADMLKPKAWKNPNRPKSS